jgi:hypothetical protein
MQDLTRQLTSTLGIPLRVQGALRLIRFQDCGNLIEACRSNGILILGIEAFVIIDNSIIPVSDLIADFSQLVNKPWDSACYEAAHSAEIFLQNAKDRPDAWFDFTLQGHK